VVVGPTPPPVHGVAVMTGEVLAALEELDQLAGHVDTRDSRPLDTIGKLDFTNVWLGLRHAGALWRMLANRPAATVYLPLSQSTWGFLRDALLVGVAKLNRRKLILHLHGGHLQDFYNGAPGLLRWLIRLVCRQASEAWALTPSLRQQFAGLVEDKRVRCVGNVVPDLGQPTSDGARASDGLRVLYLSNLLPEKGCFDLMAALRLLGPACSGWEVRLAGPATPAVESRLRDESRALADHGVAVELVGPVSGQEKVDQYRWADLFVYPSYYGFEGQPLVLLEALSAGLPIVSTLHAGIPDTVRDGIEGVLVPPGKVEELAEAMLDLAGDGEVRKRYAKAARERFVSSYSRSRLTLDFEDVRA